MGRKTFWVPNFQEAITDARTVMSIIAWRENKCREQMRTPPCLRSHTEGSTPATPPPLVQLHHHNHLKNTTGSKTTTITATNFRHHQNLKRYFQTSEKISESVPQIWMPRCHVHFPSLQHHWNTWKTINNFISRMKPITVFSKDIRLLLYLLQHLGQTTSQNGAMISSIMMTRICQE